MTLAGPRNRGALTLTIPTAPALLGATFWVQGVLAAGPALRTTGYLADTIE